VSELANSANHYEVIIIGGGPAGFTAAFYAEKFLNKS